MNAASKFIGKPQKKTSHDIKQRELLTTHCTVNLHVYPQGKCYGVPVANKKILCPKCCKGNKGHQDLLLRKYREVFLRLFHTVASPASSFFLKLKLLKNLYCHMSALTFVS